MVPKAVQDAGYTAVGLGVLALQQIQVRRRAVRARLETEARAACERVDSTVSGLRSRVEPIAGLVRMPEPLCAVAESGRTLLRQALRRGRP